MASDAEHLARALTEGSVPLQMIGDVLRNYGNRPEHKSLGPSGQAAELGASGQLQRRAIRSSHQLTALIGKEGNRLLERSTGEVTDVEEYRNTYTAAIVDRWESLALPVLRSIRDIHGNTKLIAKAGRVSERQVRNWLNGADAPHAGASGNRQRAEQVAVDWASEQIHAAGKAVPSHPAAVLYAYLTRYNEIT